jgi:hypothetical protein
MAPAAPGRRSASLLNVLLAVAVLVAVGGVSFAVGRATAPAPTFAGIGNDGNLPGGGIRPNGGTGAPGGAGGGFGGGFGGGLTLRGTVTAVDAGTVTIELTGGASVTVSKDGTTTYHQSVTGASTDVVIGKKVEIQLGSFDRTGNGAPGSQATGPVGTATNITVVQ